MYKLREKVQVSSSSKFVIHRNKIGYIQHFEQDTVILTNKPDFDLLGEPIFFAVESSAINTNFSKEI